MNEDDENGMDEGAMGGGPMLALVLLIILALALVFVFRAELGIG